MHLSFLKCTFFVEHNYAIAVSNSNEFARQEQTKQIITYYPAD